MGVKALHMSANTAQAICGDEGVGSGLLLAAMLASGLQQIWVVSHISGE